MSYFDDIAAYERRASMEQDRRRAKADVIDRRPTHFIVLAPVPSNARSLGAAVRHQRTEQPSASAGRWHLLALGLVLSFLGFVGAMTLLAWISG